MCLFYLYGCFNMNTLAATYIASMAGLASVARDEL